MFMNILAKFPQRIQNIPPYDVNNVKNIVKIDEVNLCGHFINHVEVVNHSENN